MSDDLLKSLPKKQVRPLITTHKTRPQMEGISSRSLLKVLPWVNVKGGFYRVNRRKILELIPRKVTFDDKEGEPVVYGPSLKEIPGFRDILDTDLLDKIAATAEELDYEFDDKILDDQDPPKHLYLIVKGKVSFFEAADFNYRNAIGTKGPGQYFGEIDLFTGNRTSPYDAIARSKVTVLRIPYTTIKRLLKASADYENHVANYEEVVTKQIDQSNRKGESKVEMYLGSHDLDEGSEPDIPSTFVEYDDDPQEYELSSSQTVLKIHTRVADLHNSPFNQTEEQVRLTIEELRESQEDAMINNRKFGLLHAADFRQRIQTRSGPPTPSDLDDLLAMRRNTKFIFAHPKAIAAFTRECTKRGIYPATVTIDGKEVIAWRGCPILTCNKIPIVNGSTSMIAMRIGEDDHGVVGLYQMGIPEEVEPSLSVRFMGIDDKAILSYLITNYFSVAVLVPDALGILENVEINIEDPYEKPEPPSPSEHIVAKPKSKAKAKPKSASKSTSKRKRKP